MQVEDRIAALEARTWALENIVRHLADETAATPAPPASARESTPPRVSAPPPIGPPQSRVAPRSARDFEDAFGGRLLAWVGGLAVAIGVVLLLAIAVSRGWIGEAERTILAGLFSGALVAGGLWAVERRSRTQAATAAVAAGIAGLFATTLAAGSLYELVSPPVAVAGAIAVGALATAIAIRWSSQGIAALGIAGALLAQPLLLDAPDAVSEIVLLFVTAASATAVVAWRRWVWLSFVTWLLTTPQWLVYLSDKGGLETVAVLVAFGALTAASAIAVARHRHGLDGIVMLTLNAAAIGAGGVDLGRFGLWLAALALAHLALGAVARRSLPREFAIGALVLGVIVGDFAIAKLLDGIPMEIAWAASGVLLAALARYAEPGLERHAAIAGAAGQLLLALSHALNEAPPSALVDGLAHPGTAAATLAIAALAFAAASLALPSGPWVTTAHFATAVIVLYGASVELVTWLADAPGTAQALLSALWAITGVGTLLAGLLGDRPLLRHAALALLMVTAGKVFLYDLASLSSLSRVASFVAFGLLLLAGAFAWERIRGDLGGMAGSSR